MQRIPALAVLRANTPFLQAQRTERYPRMLISWEEGATVYKRMVKVH